MPPTNPASLSVQPAVSLRESYSREQILSLIKSFAGQANIIAVPRIFVALTGDTSLALMLSQLLYWSDRSLRPDGFIFKSAREWLVEVGVTSYAVGKFNALPYVETKVLRANGSPTTHYRIIFDVLVDHMMALLEMDSSFSENPFLENTESISRNQEIHLSNSKSPFIDFNKSLTEITTKTTTETVNPKGLAQNCAPPSPDPSPVSVSKPKKRSKPKTEPSPLQYPMMQAIAKVTGSNIKIRDMAARIGRVASQLLEAGYTPEDVLNFEAYWQENDWRWKKSRMLPRPTDIQSLIDQSKSSDNYEQLFEEKRAAAIKELEDFQKQFDEINKTGEPQ